MQESAVGRAGGKVILLGEHAVVHGSRSIALGLEKGVEVAARKARHGCSLSIPALKRSYSIGDGSREGQAVERLLRALGLEQSGMEMEAVVEIPAKAGLGSSAALAVATARAATSLAKLEVTPEILFDAVQESERVFHGNPSGLDATVALHGGVVVFSRSEGARSLAAEAPPILVYNSGTQGDTREMVSKFAKRLDETGGEGRSRLKAIFNIVEEGIDAVDSGDHTSLGRLMCECHGQLAWFGMSTPALDRIVDAAMEAGALGAKLTGAGGGGCAVVLTEPGDEIVERCLSGAGFTRVIV